MSAHQTRMWIFGLAAFALTIMIAEIAGAPAYVSALAAAIAMIAVVLTVRIASGDDPHDGNPHDGNPDDPHRRPRHGEPMPIRIRTSDHRRG